MIYIHSHRASLGRTGQRKVLIYGALPVETPSLLSVLNLSFPLSRTPVSPGQGLGDERLMWETATEPAFCAGLHEKPFRSPGAVMLALCERGTVKQLLWLVCVSVCVCVCVCVWYKFSKCQLKSSEFMELFTQRAHVEQQHICVPTNMLCGI